MPMFFYMCEVRPSYANPKYGECDGAIVSCWARRQTVEEAAAVASVWFENQHWECVRHICYGPVNREIQLEHLSHLADGLRYLEQAESSGEAFAFYPLWVALPPEDRQIGFDNRVETD